MQNLNTILNLSTTSDKLFFGESGHGISRYDVVRYPVLQKLNKHMRTLFWEPESIDMSGEKRSFAKMSDTEQFVFTENLKRQILLDSVQGRAPCAVFSPVCTDPSLENCLATWQFFETIHSESYTHILRAIYPDPSTVVESISGIKEIADCAQSISVAYDRMITSPSKENLYLALIAANALEAIRFYVSFACTFNFGERGVVEGSAKTVRYIARDETQHLALTQHLLKLLPRDDPEFVAIIADNRSAAIRIYDEATEQEKEWAAHITSRGSFLGLNEGILCDYAEERKQRQLVSNGLSTNKNISRTLPWMDHWLSSKKVQVAPQETEVAAYLSATALFNDTSAFDAKGILDSNPILL